VFSKDSSDDHKQRDSCHIASGLVPPPTTSNVVGEISPHDSSPEPAYSSGMVNVTTPSRLYTELVRKIS